MTAALCTILPDRASIIVSGEDRKSFLQNLITQDVSLLDTIPLIYSCLLTPQGKFLFDFFIRNEKDTLIIDCEGGVRAQSLLQRLSMYKLRSKVALSLKDNEMVYQIFSPSALSPIKIDDVSCLPDPRHVQCGYRMYGHISYDKKNADFDIWDKHRIRLEVPDGSRDLIPDKSFIHEGRLDDFHAISYKKGCYVGQELVSRMHHRGLTKKILKCVDVADLPEKADLRSSCNGVGLALVRV